MSLGKSSWSLAEGTQPHRLAGNIIKLTYVMPNGLCSEHRLPPSLLPIQSPSLGAGGTQKKHSPSPKGTPGLMGEAQPDRRATCAVTHVSSSHQQTPDSTLAQQGPEFCRKPVYLGVKRLSSPGGLCHPTKTGLGLLRGSDSEEAVRERV